jgi:GNAT superfamily N-acetyltransferase
VAVTCHYDVADWLEPDWVVDMAMSTCRRRRLRRPPIELELRRAKRGLWKLFAPHHYLSGALSARARSYAAFWKGVPVSFCATVPLIGRRNHWRITRVVTLPDYQGVGIGMRVAEAVGELYRAAGCRLNVTGSHPALIAHCAKSPLWRTVRVLRTGSGNTARFVYNYRGSAGRAVVSFEYLGSTT